METLHQLCNQTDLPHTLGEGLRVKHGVGYATIVPDAYRSLVHITSEAVSSEFAQELCDFYTNRIREITAEE